MLKSSRTLNGIQMCYDDVWTNTTLNCSKLLDTDKRLDGNTTSFGWMLLTDECLDAPLGRPEGNMDPTSLSWNMHKIFLEHLK